MKARDLHNPSNKIFVEVLPATDGGDTVKQNTDGLVFRGQPNVGPSVSVHIHRSVKIERGAAAKKPRLPKAGDGFGGWGRTVRGGGDSVSFYIPKGSFCCLASSPEEMKMVYQRIRAYEMTHAADRLNNDTFRRSNDFEIKRMKKRPNL